MLKVFDNIKYFFIGIIMSFCLLFDIPMHAIGRPVDLTGYELVWSDEFGGDTLDGGQHVVLPRSFDHDVLDEARVLDDGDDAGPDDAARDAEGL